MSEQDEPELEGEELDSLIERLGGRLDSCRHDLEKANTTIVNLLRNQPLVYLEVAQAAIIQDMQKEREVWENENRRMKDKLRAVKEVLDKSHLIPGDRKLLTIQEILGRNI